MSTERKPAICSIRALKLICILLLFWHHSPLQRPPVDLGARTCEFLFVASGFLVAYQHADRQQTARWRDSYVYLRKKICTMWPLHVVCFLLVVLRIGLARNDLEEWVTILLNIFLVQSWVNRESVFFSFNGTSWFLSAILFCYFMSPFLLKGLKTRRSAAVSFVLVACLRLLADYLSAAGYVPFTPYNTHVSPLIRIMEFYLGMTLYRFHSTAEDFLQRHHIAQNRLLFSAAELLTLVSAVTLVITMEGTLRRSGFVLIFCIVVFVFSFDRGLLSAAAGGGNRNSRAGRFIALLAGYEFEFYLLHQPMVKYGLAFMRYFSLQHNAVAVSVTGFILTCALAWAWKRWLHRRATAWMQQTLGKIERWFGFSI